MKTKLKKSKYVIIFAILIISIIGSNVVWYKLYNSQRERVKNSLIPPLTNDYYSNQLILTNDIKKYEGNFTYNEEVAISGKYNYLEGLKQSNFYDVPLISQLPTYPNGCEAASAVMLLNYYGVNITLEEFMAYLPKEKIYTEDGTRFGPNPALYYAGNPKSPNGGWGCFDIVIAKTINTILENKNLSLSINLKEGKERLSAIAYNGPSLIWVTIDYEEVKEVFTWTSYDKKETFTYPKDEHVVVLTGYDEEYYYINDPLKNKKNIKVKKEQLEKCYDSLGRQSVEIIANVERRAN